VLSRQLAMQGHFPAIDILQSVSRVMSDIVSDSHAEATRTIIQLMAEYRNSEDLINLGAYQQGSNARLDAAIQMKEPIDDYLKQRREVPVSIEESWKNLETLTAQGRSLLIPRGKTR